MDILIKKIGVIVLKELQEIEHKTFLCSDLNSYLSINMYNYIDVKKEEKSYRFLGNYNVLVSQMQKKVMSEIGGLNQRALTYLKKQGLVNYKKGLLISTSEGIRLATLVEEANIKLCEAQILEEQNLTKKDKMKHIYSIRKNTIELLKEKGVDINSYFLGYGNVEISKNPEELIIDEKELDNTIKKLIGEKLKKIVFTEKTILFFRKRFKQIQNNDFYKFSNKEEEFNEEKLYELWKKLIDYCLLEKEVEL